VKVVKFSVWVVLIGAVLFSTSGFALNVASAPGNQTQTNNSIASFWQKFKAAAIKSDKETVASLSRFPISRGYGMANIRNKAQFLRRYRDVFFNETNAAQCFAKATPVIDEERPQEFTISCPFASGGGGDEPFVYTFRRTRNGWKFTSFENINE